MDGGLPTSRTDTDETPSHRPHAEIASHYRSALPKHLFFRKAFFFHEEATTNPE